MIADTRPRAGGNIGPELASKSPPDGYTTVLSSLAISLGPHVPPRRKNNSRKDLTPIAPIDALPNVLVAGVHPQQIHRISAR